MEDNISSKLYAQSDALFNSIGDGAIATDEFGIITRINPVAQQILGFEEHDVIGKWFPEKIQALHEDNSTMSLIDRPITRAFLTGEPVKETSVYRKKDGSGVPVSITVSPITLDGRPIGAIEVFRDISFETEVDRMKSEFISLASHQLRTPLSAIKTYTHMLLDGYMGEVTAAQRRALMTVITSSNRMNELISTLLNITRIETGNIIVSPRQILIQKLLQEELHEIQHSAAKKNLSIQLDVSASAQKIHSDALILREIMANLLTNAIKYSSDNGAITVKVQSRGDYIVLSVQDSGFGIPKQAKDKIFTKFYRAPNALQHETSGTGLGLYMVKGLVGRLGGTIRFKSQENVGTTFYVKLPKELTQPAKP